MREGGSSPGELARLAWLCAGGQGIAARALAQLGVDFESARVAVCRRRPKGSEGPISAPAVVAALQAAVAEARRRGHAEVDAPHVLLVLLGLDNSFVAQWLEKLGIDVQSARQSLLDALDELGKT